MINPTNWIAQALTPGVALTCVILYNTSLQNRFIYITGRVRELNREARGLRADPASLERLRSLQWQVGLMSRRALLIRRAVMTVYGSFLGLIGTVFALAGAARYPETVSNELAFWTFAGGLGCFAAAGILSLWEMYLAFHTVAEDTRTTYPGSPASGV